MTEPANIAQATANILAATRFAALGMGFALITLLVWIASLKGKC